MRSDLDPNDDRQLRLRVWAPRPAQCLGLSLELAIPAQCSKVSFDAPSCQTRQGEWQLLDGWDSDI